MPRDQYILIANGTIFLYPQARGFHVITSELIQKLPSLPVNGLLYLSIMHTSAGLTINECADPDVLIDFETIFNRLVPENLPGLQHTIEGPDDMPAHIKTALVGTQVTIPIVNHALLLGTWQGIYLCEFRNHPKERSIAWTILS